MQKSGISEVIIQDIAGCGKFQVIITLCVYFLANSSPTFTVMFMSFGNFNPGWKCNTHNSTMPVSDIIGRHNNNFSTIAAKTDVTRNEIVIPDNVTHATDTNRTSGKHVSDSCPVFESCERVEFNSESSTIVSEWGLVCSKKWIPSLIISIQMSGVLVGGFIAGYLGDAIGRKVTIYGALSIMTCLNVVSIFSWSWQIFAALRFFLGMSSACVILLYYMYTAEFVKKKWRSILQGIPAWSVSTILFALTCMYFKDWRYIHIVTVILGVLGLIPVVWIPESLRWLEVKNKTDKLERAARRVVRTNGKILPPMEEVGKMVNHEMDSAKSTKTYHILHLFTKSHRLNTFLLMVPWFIVSLVTFVIGFGVKAMHGDFYLNLMISSSVEIPFAILPIVAPNLLGRKLSAVIFTGLTSLCLLGASCTDRLASDSIKGTGILVLIFTGKATLSALWCVLAIITLEIYPTVIRGIGTSTCMTTARIGAIVAPFLVPDDEHSVFISYTIMGVLLLAACGFLIGLPETKDKQLQET